MSIFYSDVLQCVLPFLNLMSRYVLSLLFSITLIICNINITDIKYHIIIFRYGKALLGLSREESGVLGDGVPGTGNADEDDEENDGEESIIQILLYLPNLT